MKRSELTIGMRVATWSIKPVGRIGRYNKSPKQMCLDGEQAIEGVVVGYGKYAYGDHIHNATMTRPVVPDSTVQAVAVLMVVRNDMTWYPVTRSLAQIIPYAQFSNGHERVQARKDLLQEKRRELRDQEAIMQNIVRRHWRAFIAPFSPDKLKIDVRLSNNSYSPSRIDESYPCLSISWPYLSGVNISLNSRECALNQKRLGKGAYAALLETINKVTTLKKEIEKAASAK